jgi:lipopolysaccharide biosynthesis glycosyltransferase
MNIAYIATDSYTSMLGISLFSLLENTRDIHHLDVYILSPDFSQSSRQMLQQMAAGYSCTLHFCDISDFEQKFTFSFSTSGFHSIVLARLLIADYLPDTLDSILYLDCDVIVHGSLKALEKTNLEGYAFAAVPELSMPTAQKRYLGLAPEDPYFNAGIMLVNLDYWRTHHLKEEFIAYYSSMNGELLYSDQDIVNYCCKGHILPLSHRYNLSPSLVYFPRYFIRKFQPAYYCESADEYRSILQHPSIIHYLGDERPWFHGNHNPYRHVYEAYKARSPWKDVPLIRGRELYLFCYHILNCITRICPWFRKAFTKWFGIYYYKLMGKK